MHLQVTPLGISLLGISLEHAWHWSPCWKFTRFPPKSLFAQVLADILVMFCDLGHLSVPKCNHVDLVSHDKSPCLSMSTWNGHFPHTWGEITLGSSQGILMLSTSCPMDHFWHLEGWKNSQETAGGAVVLGAALKYAFNINPLHWMDGVECFPNSFLKFHLGLWLITIMRRLKGYPGNCPWHCFPWDRVLS